MAAIIQINQSIVTISSNLIGPTPILQGPENTPEDAFCSDTGQSAVWNPVTQGWTFLN